MSLIICYPEQNFTVLEGMKTKLLSQLVKQFQDQHQRLPQEIVIHPVALAALALKRSIATRWNGIPVICKEIKPDAKASGMRLGITIVDSALRGFDL
jgi:hypothetical protein